MSDKTNYQEMRFDPHPTQRMVDVCCARIARLEAKNERGSKTIASYIREVRHVGIFAAEMRDRVEQAEAERDALRDANERQGKTIESFIRQNEDIRSSLGQEPDADPPRHLATLAKEIREERDALRDRVRELEQGNLEEGPFGWGMREGGEK